MAQSDLTIQNQSFPSFRSDLNDALTAINTTQSGISRPSSAVAGTIWLDTTNATNPTLKLYDGADDISLATLDYSANTVNWLDSTVSFDIVNDLSPQLGGMLDVNGQAIGNGTEELIKFSETASAVNEVTVTNSATGNAPEISATGDDTNIDFKLTPKGTGKLVLDGLNFPTADGTTGQFLKTDGSGNLSFDDAGGGGKIGQVLQTTISTTQATGSSNSWVDVTGLSQTITPVATSSKILVLFHVNICATTNDHAGIRLTRGATAIYTGGDATAGRNAFSSMRFMTDDQYHVVVMAGQYLDSPNTTSATTYKIEANSNATFYINRSYTNTGATTIQRPSTVSGITVMEVLA